MTEARTSRPPHTDRSFGSVADATGGFVDAVRCSSATHGVDASASLADGLCVSQTTYSQHGADVSACLMSMERSSKTDGARPTRSVAGQLGASSLENAPDLGNTSGVCRRRHNGAQPDRLQAMLRQDTRTAARRLCNCLPPGVRQCLIIAIVVPGCMAFKGPACGSQHMSGFTAHSSDKLSWDTIPVFIFSAPRLRACLLWPVPPHVLRAQPWLMHVMQAADHVTSNH